MNVQRPVFILLKHDHFCLECQKQLEDRFEQELEDAKKAFVSDGAAQVSQFSNEITNSTEICKAIADKKIELATEAYMRVRNPLITIIHHCQYLKLSAVCI